LLLTDPQPSETELQELREAQSHARIGDEKNSEAGLYLELLARYHGAASGRLLQIGCIDSEITAIAEAAGYEVTAIDDSITACDAARGRLKPSSSTQIVCGEIFDLPGEASYDIALIP